MKKKYLLVAATALVLSIVTGFYVNSLVTAKGLNEECPQGEGFPNGVWLALERVDFTPPANSSLAFNETDIWVAYAVAHPGDCTWMGGFNMGNFSYAVAEREFRLVHGCFPDYIYWEPTGEYYNITDSIDVVGGLREEQPVVGACLASAWGLFSVATVVVVRKEKQRNG